MNESSNRLNGLSGFPLLYPDAGTSRKLLRLRGLDDSIRPVWDGTR